MEDLSRKLGITKSAIYYHVPSKEELLRLARRPRAGRAVRGRRPGPRRATAGPSPSWRTWCAAASRLLVRELPFVTLLLRVRGNTKVERAALARRRDFDRLVTDLVTRARDEGDLRADIDPATTSRLLFGMVNSLIEWYRPRGTGDVDIADTIVAVAFDGLRVRQTG